MNTDIEINGNMELSKHSPLEQFDDVMEENVDEKAKSKSQQKFFGMVDAYKKGEMPNASPAIKKAADGMSMKQVKDFAKTKHKGLPNHVDESALRKIVRNTLIKLQEGINLPSDEAPNEEIYTMEDWRRDGTLKVKEGQLIAPDVYFQLLESMPPASSGRIFQPGEAYSYDWKYGVQLYRTFKNEGNNYYRYIGLQPVAKYTLPDANKSLYRAVNENIDELSNDTIDNAYIKVMNDVNTLPYGTPERVRRDAQLKNIKTLRNDKLGFDPVDMSIKMRQQGTSGNPSIDRKWATWQKNHDDRISGRRTYDDKTGRWTTRLNENDLRKIIRETVQMHLVDVLGKYTQGKVSSKDANKAIMDLANSSNQKKLNEEVDARTLEYFNKIRNGECETLEWEGKIFRVPPQLKQIAQQVSNKFGVVASPYVYQNDSRIYCALLVDAPEDCDFYSVHKNIKLFLLEYDLHYIGCYHRTIFFVRQILEKKH